jgi:acyl-CoA thioesterase-1
MIMLRFLLIFFLTTLSPALLARTILFLGDSLTEGYRVAKEEAYPALVEQELRKKHPGVKVINGGVSGATSASALKRLDWYLKAKPDIMVLALGANDGLRGLKPAQAEKNLAAVIEKAQSRGIKVVLAGMKMPTNMGESYRQEFEGIFPRLAKKYSLTLIPFLLEGVAVRPEYNLGDGIHPNPKGHEIMAQTVIKVLGPLL